MRTKNAVPLLLALFLIGCGVSPYQYGKQALEMGDYHSAVASLQDAVRTEPEHPHTWRELGIAYYRRGEYAEAQPHLERAYRLNPADAGATLYLAMTYERNAQYEQALATYDHLAQIARLAALRELVTFHHWRLKAKWHQQRISDILTQKADITIEGASDQTVAVMPLASLDGTEESTEFALTLTYLVSNMLGSFPNLATTDLPLIYGMLEGLGLDVAAPVDVTLGAQIGRLLAVGTVLTGTVRLTEPGEFQLDMTLMRVHQGEIYEFDPIVGTPGDLVGAMPPLIDRVLRIFATSSDRTIERMPTENPDVLLEFAKGSKFFDAEVYDKAAVFFRRAVEGEPDFWRARLFLNLAEQLMRDGAKAVGLDDLEKSFLHEELSVMSRQALLDRIDIQLGQGFMAVGEPQQVRGNGNQQFPGTDRALTIRVQWK
ncbi:MAG: tetratricopeptide repeat protein [Candidatus Poribacteria bacterium]|nr:tetratricopeptide repeat protein [Candidatus Poribacteria bacterium]